MNLRRRVEELERRRGDGSDLELLDLIGNINTDSARCELKRRVAAGTGSGGRLLEVASALLAGYEQVESMSPEAAAALDCCEGEALPKVILQSGLKERGSHETTDGLLRK
jgi:hypothetical protein